MTGLLGRNPDPIVEKSRGKPIPAKRAMMSQARSIAFSSIWASECMSATRPGGEPKFRRFGISRGGRNSGRTGRAGCGGGSATPIGVVPSIHDAASSTLAAALAAASGVARTATAPALRVLAVKERRSF